MSRTQHLAAITAAGHDLTQLHAALSRITAIELGDARQAVTLAVGTDHGGTVNYQLSRVTKLLDDAKAAVEATREALSDYRGNL